MADENDSKKDSPAKAEGGKASPGQQQPPKGADATRLADAPTKTTDGNPMTGIGDSPAADAPRSKERPPKVQQYGAMPGPDELERARKARFGDGPGTIRIDAAPANSGPDAEGTQLVFVDGDGRVVGREAYVPGNYR